MVTERGAAKRIIPCLDVMDGMVVKGTRFLQLRDAGEPVELAIRYEREGADELVFLDITATLERRATLVSLVRRIARSLFIPFTVGGGISSLGEARALLEAGADKVSINTAALRDPALIRQLAERFGSQSVVVAIDAKRKGSGWEAYLAGGRVPSGRDVVAWAREAAALGAGEILVTSIDADGTKAGYDLPLTRSVSDNVSVPVIASGGAGTLASIAEAFTNGKADAALVASMFHFNQVSIRDVKEYLAKRDIRVRI